MKQAIIQTDPIADMLSRIRNAIAVNKEAVEMPHSILKEKVARILLTNGFLADVEVVKDENRKVLKITTQTPTQPARITEITRLSRPGRRMYIKSQAIPVVKRGRGIVIVSTSKGVMSGQEAKNKQMGGELICKVY